MSEDHVKIKVDGKEYTFDIYNMDESCFNGRCSYKVSCLSSSPAPSSLSVGSEYDLSVSMLGQKYEGKLKYSGSVYSRGSGFYALYFEGTSLISADAK